MMVSSKLPNDPHQGDLADEFSDELSSDLLPARAPSQLSDGLSCQVSDGSPSGVAGRQLLISRRSLFVGTISAAVLMAIGGTAKALAGGVLPVRPPGSLSEEHFIGACIRCNRCRGACPRDVIVNCDVEDGIIHMRTPKLNFHTKSSKSYRREEGKDQAAVAASPYQAVLAATGSGFCDFCMLCVQNCPTGALSSFDPQSQWIGEAIISPAYCIAFEKLGGCRKCADYCPFDAISIDQNRYPVVDPAKCNGCGICENICPSSTYRSYKGSSRRGINIVASAQARPVAVKPDGA